MVQKSLKKTTKSPTVTKVTPEKAAAKKTVQPSTDFNSAKTTRAKDQAAPSTRKPTKPRRGTGVKVTDEQIRARAFEIYLARNGASGDAASDWIQAERELRGPV